MNDERKGPNTNCLDGMRCPRCGSYEPFTIYGLTGNAVVYDEGTEEVTGIEWEDDAECLCQECDFRAPVLAFRDEPTYGCDGCGAQYHNLDRLRPVQDLESPQECDDPRPSGECPVCGAPCYLMKGSEDEEESEWELVVTPFDDFDLEEVRS